MKAQKQNAIIFTLYLLLVIMVVCCTSCKTYSAVSQPIVVEAPDSLPDPLPSSYYEFVRTTPTHGVYLPMQPPPMKAKNSYNTNSNNKKSGNSDSYNNNKKAGQQQDVGNTEIKDKSVEKIKAKDAGVIGNENEVKQEKGIPPLVLYFGLLLVVLGLLYKFRIKIF